MSHFEQLIDILAPGFSLDYHFTSGLLLDKYFAEEAFRHLQRQQSSYLLIGEARTSL